MNPFLELVETVLAADRNRIRASGTTDFVISKLTTKTLFDHTPGHVGFTIQRGGEHILVTSVAALHQVIHLMPADEPVDFAFDTNAATLVRQNVLYRVSERYK